MTKKLFIKTWGCQMNEYDSDRIQDLLSQTHQVELTDDDTAADILVLNTCSIREKAQEKVFSQLGRWRKLKETKPDIAIAVGGCVAGLGEALRHPLRIIDVHLAPVGADKDALFRILSHSGLVSLRHWVMKTKNGRKVITLRPLLKKGRRDYFFPRRVPRPISLASLERWAA